MSILRQASEYLLIYSMESSITLENFKLGWGDIEMVGYVSGILILRERKDIIGSNVMKGREYE